MPSISALSIDNFRSHTATHLELHTPHVVITGPNGSGKTNILEACSFLAPGRGLRHKPASHALRVGTPHPRWTITADLDQHPNSPLSIHYESKALTRTFAHHPISPLDLNTILSIWWHTPLVDHMLQTPSARRHIIDRSASRIFSEHLKNMSAYKHYTQQRLDILKQHSPSSTLLDTLEEHIVSYAHHITQTRLQTINDLSPHLEQSLITPHGITIRPTSSLEQQWLDNPQDMQNSFRKQLRANRIKDQQTQRMQHSIHHAVFAITLDKATPISLELCSTGQRKVCALHILMASIHHHIQTTPKIPRILLLDETLTHLDTHTCTHFSQHILSLDIQTWCTSYNNDIMQYFPHQQHICLES